MKKVFIIIGIAFATTAQAQTIIKKQLMPQQLVIDYQMPVAKPSTDYAAVVTPMICSATDTIRFQSVIVRGARNAKAMHRDMRLNHKHEAELPYLRAKDLTADGITGQVVADLSEYPWVRTEPISLCMLTELEGCCHVNTIDISCADLGRSMVPTRVPLLRVQLSPDDYKKVRQLEGRAYIDFRVNKIDLDPNYRRNPQELKKIMATIDQVRGKKDVDIDRVTIHGYASPEGSYEHNAWKSAPRFSASSMAVWSPTPRTHRSSASSRSATSSCWPTSIPACATPTMSSSTAYGPTPSRRAAMSIAPILRTFRSLSSSPWPTMPASTLKRDVRLSTAPLS